MKARAFTRPRTSMGAIVGLVLAVMVALASPASATLPPSINPNPSTVTGQTCVALSQSINYQVQGFTGTPTYSATGLPAGISIDPTTGAVTGTPTNSVSSLATITASDATVSQDATATVSFLLSPRALGFQSLQFSNTAFPDTAVGQSSTITVTITNSDCVGISIGALLTSSSTLNVDSTTCLGTLTVAATCTAQVTWSPTQTGALAPGYMSMGNLDASSDALGTASTDLTGLAIAATPPTPPAPATYTLGLDGNGGTCSPTSLSGASGASVTLPGASACSRTGYDLTGWATAGGGSSFAPGAVVTLSGDNTLQAQWRAIALPVVQTPLAPPAPTAPTPTTTVPPTVITPQQTPAPGSSVVVVSNGTGQAAVTCSQASTARGTTTSCGDTTAPRMFCRVAGQKLPLVDPVPQGRAPGLYVQVLDGIINISNRGGSQNFTAGQFGYSSSFVQPPIVLPSNPGMQFTPPPAFSASGGQASSASGNKPGSVDCEVRAASKSASTGAVFAQGDIMIIQAGGLKSKTPVSVYIGSAPTLVGDFETDADGYLSAWARVPASQAVGDTAVQVNGVTTNGYQLSVITGVAVSTPKQHRQSAAITVASGATRLSGAARTALTALLGKVPATVPVSCTVTSPSAASGRLVAAYLKAHGLTCTRGTARAGGPVRVVAAYAN